MGQSAKERRPQERVSGTTPSSASADAGQVLEGANGLVMDGETRRAYGGVDGILQQTGAPVQKKDMDPLKETSAALSTDVTPSNSTKTVHAINPEGWREFMQGHVAADHVMDEGQTRLDMGIGNQTRDGRNIPDQMLQETEDEKLKDRIAHAGFSWVRFDRFYKAMDAWLTGETPWNPELKDMYALVESKTVAMVANVLAEVGRCGPDVGVVFRDGTRYTVKDLVTADRKPEENKVLQMARKVMQLCYEKVKPDVLSKAIDLNTANQWEMNLHWNRQGNDFVLQDDAKHTQPEDRTDAPPDKRRGDTAHSGPIASGTGRYTSDVKGLNEVWVFDHTGRTTGPGWDIFEDNPHKTVCKLTWSIIQVDGKPRVAFKDRAGFFDAQVPLVYEVSQDPRVPRGTKVWQFPLQPQAYFINHNDAVDQAQITEEVFKKHAEAFQIAVVRAVIRDDMVGNPMDGSHILEETTEEKGQRYANRQGLEAYDAPRRAPR